MLTRLLPADVSNYWNLVRWALHNNMPPHIRITEEVITNILETTMDEASQVWILHKGDEANKKETLIGIGVTCIITEPLSKQKSLLIYALVGGMVKAVASDWEEALVGIRQFAIGQGCVNIVAYSDVPETIGLVKKLGGNVDVRFLILGVR